MIYKLQLSTKGSINISEEEFQKFKENISSNFIEFKEGIINPSFVVCATIDWEATREENRHIRAKENLKELSSSRGEVKDMKTLLENYKPKFIEN